MLLTADIGNTSITLGLFDDAALIEEYRLAADKDLSLEEYEVLLKSLFRNYNVDGCIISSVVEELTKKFKTSVDNVFKIDSMILSTDINTGIKIALDNPKEAGADRIANAVGAYVLYKHPVIVVDLGTATTFDVVDSHFHFEGIVGLNSRYLGQHDEVYLEFVDDEGQVKYHEKIDNVTGKLYDISEEFESLDTSQMFLRLVDSQGNQLNDVELIIINLQTS